MRFGNGSPRPTQVREPMPKVSPMPSDAGAMAEAKHVDAGPRPIS